MLDAGDLDRIDGHDSAPAAPAPSPAVVSTPSLPGCARHLFRQVRERALEKHTTTGHPSGVWGIWQTRRCIYCQAASGRWKKGVDGKSPGAANRANRPNTMQDWIRSHRRETKLANLESEHLAAVQAGVAKARHG